MFKVSSQWLLGILKAGFWKIPAVEYFTDMDQLVCWIFHQDLGKHETKIDESACIKIICTKIQVCTSKNIARK